MNAVALSFASGEVFFIGMLICQIGVFFLGLGGSARIRPLLRTATLLGIALVAASGTPLAWGHYLLWIGLVAGALLGREWGRSDVECGGRVPPRDGDTALASDPSGRIARRARIATLLMVAAMTHSLVLVALEARHHLAPNIAIPGSIRVLHVIGDSLAMLSFDAEAEDRSWPQLLGEAIGLDLIPTTAGGATVASALRDAEPYLGPEQLVLLEIGGNDLLFGADPAAFRSDLDRLLAAAGGEGRIVVMFELPLPPFANRYGRIQRELARQYGASLIPKRFLTRVLGMPGATVDGLHLSVRGHAELARAIAPLLHRP